MTFPTSFRLRPLAFAILGACAGCTVVEAPRPVERAYVQPAPAAYVATAPQAVVSVYVEPPILQPAPILVGWAPPPMLVEAPTPLPYGGAVWVGGYWVWDGNWVWAAGHWAAPPQPDYGWVNPYYEHRDTGVVFITGHWSPPGVVFVAPPIGLSLTLAIVSPGVVPGPRPIGPLGVFVPPPPGSRFGLIVPAPIGTPPAVVVSAAPVVNVGMRIQSASNTTINNTRVTNVTNITNVTIVAPASATASGKAYEGSVPAQAHLAAALPAVVHVAAPVPASIKPIASFVPGRAPVVLPPAQLVHSAPAAPAAPPHTAVMMAPAAAPPAPASPAPAGRPAVATAPMQPVPNPTPTPVRAEAPRPAPPLAGAPREKAGKTPSAPTGPATAPRDERAQKEGPQAKAMTLAHAGPAAQAKKKDKAAEKAEKAEAGEKKPRE